MSLKKRIIGLAAIGAAALALAPVAQAKTQVAKAPKTQTTTTTTTTTTSSTTLDSASLTTLVADQPCDAPASQVFAPWGDSAFYSLVDGGSFEAGAPGWSLAGGAKVVADNNDGLVSDGVADTYALELGAGALATSPAICVGTDSASYRMFANAARAGTAANLRVEVLFAGTVVKSDDLTSPAGTSVPTPRLAFVPTVIDSLIGSYVAGYSTTVNIRVSSLNGATVRVDDLYMDPRMH